MKIQLGKEYMNIYDSDSFLLKCSLTPLVQYEIQDTQFWCFFRMLSFPRCNTILHKISSAFAQKNKQVIKKSHAYWEKIFPGTHMTVKNEISSFAIDRGDCPRAESGLFE